jgi:hypothetical protein
MNGGAMDKKEEALNDLLDAIDRWEGALIDFQLSDHTSEYKRAMTEAEDTLIGAHREYWIACKPPEPEPTVCPHCEAAWNAHHKDAMEASAAADEFVARVRSITSEPRLP